MGPKRLDSERGGVLPGDVRRRATFSHGWVALVPVAELQTHGSTPSRTPETRLACEGLDPIACQRSGAADSVSRLRPRWPLLVNAALARKGSVARLDQRSFKARGRASLNARLETFKQLARRLKTHFEGLVAGMQRGAQQRLRGGHEWADAKRQVSRTRVQNEQEFDSHCVPAPVQAQAFAGQPVRIGHALLCSGRHASVLRVKLRANRH